MRFDLDNIKAFSLVEIIVGFGLFSLLATLSTSLLLTSLRSARKGIAIATVRNEGSYALEAIKQGAKFGLKANCGAATLNIQKVNGDWLIYTYDGTNKRLSSNISGVSTVLTSSKVSVTLGSCGAMFACAQDMVTICFMVDVSKGSDVTDYAGSGSTGIVFQSQVQIRNFPN